jgi:hypothetical protein
MRIEFVSTHIRQNSILRIRREIHERPTRLGNIRRRHPDRDFFRVDSHYSRRQAEFPRRMRSGVPSL